MLSLFLSDAPQAALWSQHPHTTEEVEAETLPHLGEVDPAMTSLIAPGILPSPKNTVDVGTSTGDKSVYTTTISVLLVSRPWEELHDSRIETYL